MQALHKNYILDENHIPCAVIIPIAEFQQMEKIFEKYRRTKMPKEVGDRKKAQEMWLEECFEFMDKAQGNSQGQKWIREELYEV